MANFLINNQDTVSAYGLHFLKGTYSQLDAMPELKDNGLSIDWASEDGTERYHGEKRFQSITYNLPCAILATSTADYEQKLRALQNFLITAGEFTLDLMGRYRRFKLSYQNMTGFNRIGNNAQFTLVLINDHPTEYFTIPA
ncbi:hypothetical protein [Sphingobacterium corticibacter]|uniref:Siphovirus-type tail component RIFT-related domain-containing protein n=1 Tax=Sphingobacterium corticibacter TaxID=2171749 RepID=A0A2T8HLK4_9SPHI|nr:hypothetical protein [Sphingobacterium corticibacter]PVH26293.1 hypothetical protein DC487_01310 [Sphingobacterium corticibacter]